MNKELFENFVKDNFPDRVESLVRFEKLHRLLWEANSKVNLISRKTAAEDYWTRHFLDSILPANLVEFTHKKILDFGSGGGLPGIPLKLLFPDSEIYLLDSKQKKMRIVENIIKNLDLKRCFTIVSRLENMTAEWFNKFDIIICRSVKILPKYKKTMLKLLKNNGEIILYKSKKLDDVAQFRNVKIIDVSLPEIGTRKIIKIKK